MGVWYEQHECLRHVRTRRVKRLNARCICATHARMHHFASMRAQVRFFLQFAMSVRVFVACVVHFAMAQLREVNQTYFDRLFV